MNCPKCGQPMAMSGQGSQGFIYICIYDNVRVEEKQW